MTVLHALRPAFGKVQLTRGLGKVTLTQAIDAHAAHAVELQFARMFTMMGTRNSGRAL